MIFLFLIMACGNYEAPLFYLDMQVHGQPSPQLERDHVHDLAIPLPKSTATEQWCLEDGLEAVN